MISWDRCTLAKSMDCPVQPVERRKVAKSELGCQTVGAAHSNQLTS